MGLDAVGLDETTLALYTMEADLRAYRSCQANDSNDALARPQIM
jgi:hypothetical protein